MNKMKNFVKEGQKLPMFGIGPYLIYGIALLKAIVLILTHYVAHIGILSGVWILIFRIVGAALIISGIAIWFTGAVRSGMDENISENKLKTDGIYSCVRNPMYTGIWFLMVGISLMWHNCFMIAMIPIDWVILTVVLKKTEEKWLLDLYGEEYENYKSRVNRCIPWFPRKH